MPDVIQACSMHRAIGFLVLLLAAFNVFSDPLDTWTWRNPLPTGNAFSAVAFGSGHFVAVGEAGSVLVSTDATNWTVQPTPSANALGAIVYGDGRFVAVGGPLIGSPPAILTSTDTTNWIAPSPATTSTLFAVGFGNGTFVAVGENETIVTSTNGTNWVKQHETPFGNRFVGAAYGNGLFMVTGGASVLVSPDGVNWTSRPPYGAGFGRVTFGNGVFLARNATYVGQSYYPRTVFSQDGTSWGVCALPISASAGGVFTYDSTKFVLLGNDSESQSNVVCTSTNGANWITNFVQGPPSPVVDLIFGDSQYIGVSGGLVRSVNLLQWSVIGSSLPITAARVFLYGNGKYVLAGTGPILVSTNGVNYETNATTGTFRAGAFGTNTFILTAGGGSIVTSTNGSNWSPRATGGSSINSLAYGSNTFVAVGGAGDIRASPNGTSWSGRFSGATVDLNAIAYGNGLFVVVGTDGVVLTSPDTITWTVQDSLTTSTLRSVAFGNNVFFAAGDGGTIRISANVVDWNAVSSSTSDILWATAATRGNLLVAGGSTVLTSLDGAQWRARRVPLPGIGAAGTTPKTFVLMGGSAVIESGELSAIGLFKPSVNFASGFHLIATGDAGSVSRLQRSTNLVDWSDMLTFTNTVAPTPLLDSSTTNSTRGFYRVIAP